jgi:hypothetical protein
MFNFIKNKIDKIFSKNNYNKNDYKKNNSNKKNDEKLNMDNVPIFIKNFNNKNKEIDLQDKIDNICSELTEYFSDVLIAVNKHEEENGKISDNIFVTHNCEFNIFLEILGYLISSFLLSASDINDFAVRLSLVYGVISDYLYPAESENKDK